MNNKYRVSDQISIIYNEKGVFLSVKDESPWDSWGTQNSICVPVENVSALISVLNEVQKDRYEGW